MFARSISVQLSLFFVLIVGDCQCAVWAGMVDENNMAVVVNINDPASIETGEYYMAKRNIPDRNMITVRMDPHKNDLSVEEFRKLESQVLRQTGENIQAYVLVWSRPFKVGCMSITSAFSMGFDRRYCALRCRPTMKSDYYNSRSRLPYSDNYIRPSMMLAADTVEQAKQLIDRGVRSDFSRPPGRAYLLDTSDRKRNVRAVSYPFIEKTFSSVLNVNVVAADYIADRRNVLFYFTGVKYVTHLDTIHFTPGAAADHLTSLGGVLHGSSQMSSMKWLEAGATASYGTVVEPCNYPDKFPNPGVLIQHYLNGDTLLEAYWKSVLMPGQGVFIGEPLAKPFGGCKLVYSQSGNVAALVNRKGSLLPMQENISCDKVPSLVSETVH